MRSYIFTNRERKVISGFLEGKIPLNDPSIEQVRSRIRSFSNLARDIELYARLRKAIETRSA